MVDFSITFLGHSGFFIELRQVCFLFDYWQGPLPSPFPDKHLLTLSSHGHKDHFNPEIFSYGTAWSHADHIVGNDVRLSAKRRAALGVQEETFHRMGPDRDKEIQGVHIHTLRSTDVGVAFLIRAEGWTIYHAGDLNWWTWPEQTEEEQAAMTQDFQREITKLREIPIDLAFLTLDGRQGQDAFRGFDYYMTHCRIQWAIPMHSFGDYTMQQAFLESPISLPYRQRVLLLTEPGSSLQFPTCS